jgi:hypothetical protein
LPSAATIRQYVRFPAYHSVAYEHRRRTFWRVGGHRPPCSPPCDPGQKTKWLRVGSWGQPTRSLPRGLVPPTLGCGSSQRRSLTTVACKDCDLTYRALARQANRWPLLVRSNCANASGRWTSLRCASATSDRKFYPIPSPFHLPWRASDPIRPQGQPPCRERRCPGRGAGPRRSAEWQRGDMRRSSP